MKKLESRCAELESEACKLNKKIRAEKELRNSLEQYTRRDNFKIINLPGDHEKETQEETESKVLSLVRQKKLGLTSFASGHISTTHRVGKYTQGRNRPVVVRLTTRKVKTEIFRQKKKLLKDNTFIYEDLTQLNTQRLFDLKKHPGVASAWSFQGKLFCKLPDLRILCIEDGDTDQIDRLATASSARQADQERSQPYPQPSRNDQHERLVVGSHTNGRGRGRGVSSRGTFSGRGGGVAGGSWHDRPHDSRRVEQASR